MTLAGLQRLGLDKIKPPFPRPLFHCAKCQGEYSANVADYFNLPEEHEFTCCGEPLQLVVKYTSYAEVPE